MSTASRSTVMPGAESHPPAPASAVPPRWLWLAAAVLMLAEFLLFDRMTSRHHASIYPRWNDQIQYLTESYRAYDFARAHGFWPGLYDILTNPAAQGVLHEVLAMPLFLLLGSPSRSAALSLNLLAFLAWQVSLLTVFRRVSGSWTVGWLAFALLPALCGPWTGGPGSAIDFRLDHAAMCLFGVSSAVALLTRGFRSTPWSIALGAVVALTLLERFLTGAYYGVIFIACVGWILGGEEKLRRLGNLALAGLVAGAMIGPVFWLNWDTIYRYYWEGQVIGADAAARAPGLAAWESVQFVADHLWHEHLGAYFGWLAAGLTLPFLAGRFLGPAADGPPPRANRDWLFFALTFLLLPALILCFHKQKSYIAVGVLVPGVLLLLGWIWTTLWPRAQAATPPGRFWRLWPAALVVLALLASAKFYIGRQLAQPHSEDFLAGATRVNLVSDRIFTAAQTAGITVPRIGVDYVTDALDAKILQLVNYERKKIWMPCETLLPTGILAEDDPVIFGRLARCDFVLLTDAMAGPEGWPYDQQMRRLHPQLKAWCESHLKRVETFQLFGREMSFYQRRGIP